MVTRSPTSNGCFTKTKINDWRNSWAVAENNHERAKTVEPREVRAVDADVEIKETKIIIVIIMTMKTENMIKLGYDGVQVFEGSRDSLPFSTNLNADSLELFHRNVPIHIFIKHGESGVGFIIIIKGMP
jgi:hypothetical protein